MSYQFYVPTRTLFGAGKLNELHRQNMSGKISMVFCRAGRRQHHGCVQSNGGNGNGTNGAPQGYGQAQKKKDAKSNRKKDPLNVADMFEAYMGWN